MVFARQTLNADTKWPHPVTLRLPIVTIYCNHMTSSSGCNGQSKANKKNFPDTSLVLKCHTPIVITQLPQTVATPPHTLLPCPYTVVTPLHRCTPSHPPMSCHIRLTKFTRKLKFWPRRASRFTHKPVYTIFGLASRFTSKPVH